MDFATREQELRRAAERARLLPDPRHPGVTARVVAEALRATGGPHRRRSPARSSGGWLRVHGLNDYPPMGGVRLTCDEDACELTLCPVELAMSDEGGGA